MTNYPLTRQAIDSLGDEMGLTQKQRNYLFMAVQGVHTENMAETMGCGEQTPSKYLSRLYQTFGVQSRHELTGLIIKRMEEIAQ